MSNPFRRVGKVSRRKVQETVSQQQLTLEQLERVVVGFLNLSLWGRLKWLLTGPAWFLKGDD